MITAYTMAMAESSRRSGCSGGGAHHFLSGRKVREADIADQDKAVVFN